MYFWAIQSLKYGDILDLLSSFPRLFACSASKLTPSQLKPSHRLVCRLAVNLLSGNPGPAYYWRMAAGWLRCHLLTARNAP